jgi:hypothetical protein
MAHRGAPGWSGAYLVVEPRDDTSPRQQMPSRQERGHIGADFGHDHLCRHPAHARDCDQPLDGVAKGYKQLLNPSIESGDAPLQLLDQAEMMVDKKSMMRCHTTIERNSKVGPGTFQTGRSKFAQSHRVCLTRNHRFQNTPPAHAHDVRDHRHEFDVGVL